MKRILFSLVVALLAMAGCSSDDAVAPKEEKPKEERNDIVKENEYEEAVEQFGEEVESINNDLREVTLNTIIDELEGKYEDFDSDAATALYKLIQSMVDQDIDVAKNMKESVLEGLESEQQEMYGDFYDKVIEMEEIIASPE